MKKNALILHGSFGSVSENWFPWLSTQLNEINVQTLIPSFPTPDNQNFENWSRIMNGYLNANLINDNTIIICHSSSCVFAVRYLIENEININTLITVAGFNNFISGNEGFDNINKTLYMRTEDCHLITNFSKKRIAVMSDNDPYLNEAVLAEFAKSIRAVPVIIKNGGHFNTASGYEKFDYLFEEIKTAANIV